MFHSIKLLSRSLFVSIFSILFCFTIITTVNSQPCSGNFEWQWLNPLPQGNLLHDVTSADGIYFAVGQGGAIVSNAAGTWRRMNSGVSVNLFGVWAAAFKDVFAVGANGTVLHWNGTAWISMPSGTTSHLRAVWGSSPDAIYAVGDGGTIIHYDGAHWIQQASGTAHRLNDVHGTSIVNVIAVGDRGKAVQFDGSGWTPIPDFRDENFYGVWVNSPTDAWTVGEKGIARHFNGLDWFSYFAEGWPNLRDMWGTGPDNIYAVGDDQDGTRVIRRWNGSNWLKVNEVPSRDLFGVWGRSETDIVTVGELGSIVSYNGTDWTQELESFTGRDLEDVWVNSADDAIAVGQGGLILHYNGSTWQQKPSGTTAGLYAIWSNGVTAYASGASKTVLKYEDGVWTKLPEPSGIGLSTILCVWGFGGNDVYVGGNRNVVHWNGTSWNNITPPEIDNTVRDIWGQSPYLFCAVGYYETWHYDGSNWTQYWLPTATTVTGVWGFAPDDVYAVAHRLMHFNGAAWSDLTGDISQYMKDVWGPAPDRLFMVGKDASYFWNGSSLEPFFSPVFGYLNAVSGTSECDIFAVGDNGRLLYAGDSLIVSAETSRQPGRFVLEQNYPNPFNPNTVISFNLDRAGHVTLTVFDVSGRRVRTLVNRNMAAGPHFATWDGRNDLGQSVATGIYFYRLKTGGKVLAKKMVLLK